MCNDVHLYSGMSICIHRSPSLSQLSLNADIHYAPYAICYILFCKPWPHTTTAKWHCQEKSCNNFVDNGRRRWYGAGMKANKVIKQYLIDNGLTYLEASKMTGYTPQHIESVCNERSKASARMLLAFEKLSNGKICAAKLV